MPDIGPLELVIVLIIAIVVVGPKKLPQLGRSLGSGMREFKDSVTGKSKDDDDDAFDAPPQRPTPAELDPTAAEPVRAPAEPARAPAEPEVVSGEARREDQPASHHDS
jgi:sec-independent protein translocase protein TatA